MKTFNSLNMKYKFFRQLFTGVLVCTLLSCSKQKAVPGTATFTIINAVPNSTPSLVTNFSGTEPLTWYSTALKLVYAKSAATNQLSAYAGEQPLAVYRYPDTLAHSIPLFNLTLDLAPGSMHTLFLTGTLSAPDTVFTTDLLPYHSRSDSTMGIRFVNLLQGGNAVSVNINGKPNGSELSSLAAKGVTDFKKYPATSGISTYKFEFRDASTGTLISNLDVTGINAVNNARRYRNFTIALMGLYNDPATQKVVLIEANLPN